MGISAPGRAIRLGSTLAAALVGAALFGTSPAHAAGTVAVSLDSRPMKLGAAGSPGKKFLAHVSSTGNVAKAKITFDYSAIAAFAEVRVAKKDLPGGNCKTEGSTLTCNLPSIDKLTVLPFRVRPGDAAKDGQEGKLKVSVSAKNAPSSTAEQLVKIVDGVDLVGGPDRLDVDGPVVKPGDRVGMRMMLRNVGSRAVHGLVITVGLKHGVVPERYSACTYTEQRTLTLATCTFPGVVLQPRQRFRVEDFAATIAPDGYGNATMWFIGNAVGDAPADAGVAAAGGKALAYTVEADPEVRSAAATEVDEFDNGGGIAFRIANTYDIEALGDTAQGAVGDVVTVDLGAKHHGQATLDTWRSGGEPATSFTFVAPRGTEVVDLPGDCLLDEGTYHCFTDDFLYAGETFTVTFSLKITAEQVEAGRVAWQQESREDETDPANNTAPVVVTVADGGEGGGELPVTGAQIGLIAGTGVALLAGGVFLFVLARRRRVVLVTPED